MICIAHLSDLHFGRADPDLRAPLLEAVNGARPDVVAISGDLTQRARSAQFREASAFIDELEAPVVIVPGNHDIPLDRPLSRLIAPFAGYRRHISLDLQPKFVSDEVAVAGINTVTRFAWQSGHVKRRALKRLCTVFGGDPERLNVVVAHHPLEQAPEVRKSPTRGAHAAIDTLSGCGADILLTGHLHTWHAGPIITRAEGGQAGPDARALGGGSGPASVRAGRCSVLPAGAYGLDRRDPEDGIPRGQIGVLRKECH